MRLGRWFLMLGLVVSDARAMASDTRDVVSDAMAVVHQSLGQ